ncbi:MAG: nitrilase [Alistipes sp.]|nr:nitrilase [Alistipes sp.]
MLRFLSLLTLLLPLCLPASGARPLRIALVQCQPPGTEVAATLDGIERRIRRCRRADLIVLPELFATGCRMTRDGIGFSRAEAAPCYDTIRTRMSRWAARTGATVIGSAVFFDGERYYNRLIAAHPDGGFSHYDKHNVFKRGGFSPGEERLTILCRGVRIVPLICYDLRFGQWSRRSDTADYDLLLYIAAWPASRREEWERLLRERAIENGTCVAGVGFCGTDANGFSFAGASQALLPDGRRSYRAGDAPRVRTVRLPVGTPNSR